jgi:hypothetical protein
MEHPTPNSGETYSTSEAIEHIEEALPDVASEVQAGSADGEISCIYDGDNRREVFCDLIEHGWAITSIDIIGSSTFVWLERLDTSEAQN